MLLLLFGHPLEKPIIGYFLIYHLVTLNLRAMSTGSDN